MTSARTLPSPPPAFQVPWLQLAVAILIPLLVFAFGYGGLDQRVAAQERVTQPLADGELRALDERTRHIQADVKWIRDRMEREAVR